MKATSPPSKLYLWHWKCKYVLTEEPIRLLPAERLRRLICPGFLVQACRKRALSQARVRTRVESELNEPLFDAGR
jgi:hypothetical protein